MVVKACVSTTMAQAPLPVTSLLTWNGDRIRGVDCIIPCELCTLDEIEDDGVLKANKRATDVC